MIQNLNSVDKSSSNVEAILEMITNGDLQSVIDIIENVAQSNDLYNLIVTAIDENQKSIFLKLLEYTPIQNGLKTPPLNLVAGHCYRTNKPEYFDMMARSCINVRIQASHQQFLESPIHLVPDNFKFIHCKYFIYAAVVELKYNDRVIIINKFDTLKRNYGDGDLNGIKNHIEKCLSSHINESQIQFTLNEINPFYININNIFKKDLATGVLSLLEEHYTKVCIYHIISLHKTLGLVCKNYKDMLLRFHSVPDEINYLVISSLHNPYPFSIDASTYHIVTTKFESLKVQHLDNPKYTPKFLIRDLYDEVKGNQLRL